MGEWEGGTGQLEETDLPEASAKQSWKMGQEKEEEVGAGDIFLSSSCWNVQGRSQDSRL